jgi:hypothetical protein
MNYELLSALAAVGTFVVIGATAMAAVVQLRHLRASNQIAAVMKLQDTSQDESFVRARRFLRDELPRRLADPDFRRETGSQPMGDNARPILVVGNYYEELGTFVKRGIIDKAMACDLWSSQVVGDWNRMVPAIAIARRLAGAALWENFEYMTGLCQEWIARYPDGVYPANRKRLVIEDVWLAEDQRQRAAR